MPCMLRTSALNQKIFEKIQGVPVNKQKAKKTKAAQLDDQLMRQESSRLR